MLACIQNLNFFKLTQNEHVGIKNK
jgi:hypothetical protein